MNRSYLFVPADSRRKLSKAADSDADALIVDLEDSVTAGSRPEARRIAREFLQGRTNTWIRINPIDTADAIADLEATMPSAPAGIVLPKPRSAVDVARLAARLDELEKELGLAAGRTRIMPICTERPSALFTLAGYAGSTSRMVAMTWGAEDLAAALGAAANRDESGNWLPTYELARSLLLLAAAAAEVPAVDTVFTDFRDTDGLKTYAARARRDGFSGMLAIHPGQIDTINRAFIPTAEEIKRAQRIVELFATNPGAGTLGLDGAMIDRPHLVQAERLLQLARKLAAP